MIKLRVAALQAPNQKYPGPFTKEKNVQWTADQIVKLANYHPDVICLAEVFAQTGFEGSLVDHAEPVPGPTVETMSKLAKDHGLAIVCPLIEKRGEVFYNTAVVIDQTGEIAGQYDKIHPTEGELESGILPGTVDPTIIELCGVKTAYQICFDANWPVDWMNQKLAGAQLIFFCSAFSAGSLLPSYAAVLRIPIVAATICRDCRIYDRLGQLIGHQTVYHDFALADVIIDQPVFHLDGQQEQLEAIRKCETDVNVVTFDGNGTWSVVGTNDPKYLQGVKDRYKLLDVDEYLARAEKAQDQARK